MSWAEEDWTVGLSGRVLQKVKELQVSKERLSRENKQKQLQLDNIHTSLEKQTAKYEEVRGELQLVQRELLGVREEAKAAVTCKERLTQELHTKQAQVCSLEGQLDAARNHNNHLSQEIKRLEAELEKLQNSSRLADTTLFSTPSWSASSPWEHNGSKQEERSGQRDEGQSRGHPIRQRLQFSDTSASSLPRQQHKSTPLRHPSDQSDIFSTPSAAFPWERDDSRPASRRRPVSSPQLPSPEVLNEGPLERSSEEKVHRTETDRSSSELQSRLSALEDQLSEKVGKLMSIQNEMGLVKKELAAKELGLQKSQDELNTVQTRMAQDRERASEAEHKLKQLQEELKCQRQNAESSRLQHQQRTKELEKTHQKDLAELQKDRQCQEKQHQQEVNKLNQELQQARTLHNALQAQADKLSLQKQALDKELDSLKEKLKWTEEQLKESQKKEAQTQTKLTEVLREAEGVAVTLKQSRKRERALEEEGRRLQEEQADTLRLLKELQEQKVAAASAPQAAQFGPIGQGFSSPSSFAPSPRATANSRRPAASQSEQSRDGGRAEITAANPPGREPGEGIDAEQITFNISNSERLQKVGQREEDGKEGESRNTPFISSADGDRAAANENSSVAGCLKISPKHTQLPDKLVPPQDLQRENNLLRSELSDVREELQRRLEDLEAQRRAETEARTRLKQLSRKHSNQAAEREEREKELKVKLDSEKAETDRLRRSVAALEAEMKRSKEETEKEEEEENQEEEKNATQNDRESELTELNIQLKNQLTMVKAQLALEREERKMEEEERKEMMNTDVNTELSLKLAEIMADVEELKHSREEDSVEEEKLSSPSSPLLTLQDCELSSSISLLPSPEEHLLFCESTNKRNALLSSDTADILHLCDQPNKEASDQKRPSLSLQQDQLTTSAVLEALQKKCEKESERAKKYRDKFEALQIQVTRQTKELTTAFEKQSQHILGLLAELQEKESALLSQGEELMKYKQELDALKKEENKAAKLTITTKEGPRDETFAEESELQIEQEKKPVVSLPSSDLNIQKETIQPNVEECDGEAPLPVDGEGESVAVTSGEQLQIAADIKRSTDGPCDSVCEVKEDQSRQHGERVDPFTELDALREENQQLKQRIKDLANMDSRDQRAQTDKTESKNSPSCLEGQGLLKLQKYVVTDQLLQINLKRRDDECQDPEGGESDGIRNPEDTTEVQINHLQQQVEALQGRVRTLSEETQVQAQELALWRLSSQPASAVQHFLTNRDDESEASQSTQQPTAEPTHSPAQTAHSQVQKSPEVITIIREDELSLCCSSKKLQGRMLFSRLQISSLPEPKSLRSPKKALQEHTQNTAKFGQESEKENQEINLQQSESCSENNKSKKDGKLIQMSSQKVAQLHVAKDVLHLSGSSRTKEENCYTGTHEAKDSFRRISDFDTASNCSNNNMKAEAVSVGCQTVDSLLSSGVSKASAGTQTEQDLGEEEESPPVSPVSSAEKVEAGDKMFLSSSFPIPADPARLAERIRRSRTQLSAAFDDTEYEPYGLPEVVMKGFADIPTGPSCPYIVRRGLLGTVQPLSKKEPREDEETD